MSAVTRSRVLALAVLVAGIALVGAVLVYPLVAYYARAADNVDARRHELARYESLAARLPALRERLAEVHSDRPSSVYYVAGATAALASADMQRQLKQLAQRSGGEVISSQILPAEDDAGQPRAGLRAHIKMDPPSLVRVLHAIESGQPMYFVDNLLIDMRPARSRSGGKIIEATELDVKFDVYGYLARTQ